MSRVGRTEWKKFEDLMGKTFERVEQVGDMIRFETADGGLYELQHDQDCCEHVYIESVVGDLQDLVGTSILVADESTSDNIPPVGEPDSVESYTWSFYKLGTIKGYVDIRFFGSSNGYYGESASLSYSYPPAPDTEEKEESQWPWN